MLSLELNSNDKIRCTDIQFVKLNIWHGCRLTFLMHSFCLVIILINDLKDLRIYGRKHFFTIRALQRESNARRSRTNVMAAFSAFDSQTSKNPRAEKKFQMPSSITLLLV